jgi:ubiquitin-conjugating enzyme E2 variant
MFIAINGFKIVCEFMLTVLLADFASGLIHWFEDAYCREDMPIIGPWIAAPNVLHHHKPREFTKKNWWQSSWDLLLLMTLVLFAAWLTHRLTWEVYVLAILAANSNEIHKWAHRTPRENGRIITFLQRARLVQTVRHHARHHTNPKESNYCVVTNILNPVLDGIRFWAANRHVGQTPPGKRLMSLTPIWANVDRKQIYFLLVFCVCRSKNVG